MKKVMLYDGKKVAVYDAEKVVFFAVEALNNPVVKPLLAKVGPDEWVVLARAANESLGLGRMDFLLDVGSRALITEVLGELVDLLWALYVEDGADILQIRPSDALCRRLGLPLTGEASR